MLLKHRILTIALSSALSGAAVAGTVVLDEPKVRTIVTEAGYENAVVVEREGDLWRVVGESPDAGTEVTVFVNSEGKVMGPSEVAQSRITESTTTTTTTTTSENIEPETVTEASVASTVREAGFHNVHDIDYLAHRGVWKAEADDITGEDFELHVDARTGAIVHIEDD